MMQAKRQPASTPSTLIDNRTRAFEIIRAKSYIQKRITLSSGTVSDHYFDMKPSMLDPDGAGLLSELVLHRMDGVPADYIGGLEMGAVPLITAIVMVSKMKGRPIPGLFVRKHPKQHGTQQQIEGTDNVKGRHVVIVDDVTTTGKSAMKSIEVLREAGAIIPLVISILDRQEGAVEFYKAAGIPFQCLFTADEFHK